MDLNRAGFRQVGSTWQKGPLSLIIAGGIVWLNVHRDGQVLSFVWQSDSVKWQGVAWGWEAEHLQAYQLLEAEPQPTHQLDLEPGDYILGTRPTDQDGQPLWRFTFCDGRILCDRLANGKPSAFRGPIQYILRSKAWRDSKYLVVPSEEKPERTVFSALMDLIN